MVRKYITRDFTNHNFTTEYLSDEDEYIMFEIFSFDPAFTKRFSVEKNTLSGENAKRTNFKAFTCFQSKDKINPMEFTVNYKVSENAEYRIDIVYEKNTNIYSDTDYNTKSDLVGWYDIFKTNSKSEHKAKVFTETLPKNASKQVKKDFEKAKKNAIKIANSSNVDKSSTAKDLKFEGENNAIKRKTIFRTFDEGDYKIEFGVPHNCYVYGVIIRKIVRFYGSNNDEVGSNLMFTKGKLTFSEMGKAAEFEADIGYDDSFECDASPTGLYINYMDECNVYVKNNEGNKIRAFGGYVSTPLPDNTREEITVHCADRLKDGENKYILDQLLLQNGDTDVSDYDLSSCISFDKYPEVLRYLCRVFEVTLHSNASQEVQSEKKKFREGFQITYGKKHDVPKIPVTNGKVTINKNNVTLRNGIKGDKKQIWQVYKATKTPIEISDFDHFHITYGLGNVKTEHKVKDTKKVDTASSTAGALKFTKCGVSEDKKYVMGIGQWSSPKGHGGLSYNQIYKSIFKNYCPHCKKEGTLVWDSGRADTKCYYSFGWHGYKTYHGKRIPETQIRCTHCDCDYDAVSGYENDSPWYHLKGVKTKIKSSKAEQTKLHKGEMVALPTGKVSVSADDIFKAIRKASKGWKHQTKTGTTASYLEKHGVGDCWAWSDWISKQLKKYKVNHKIVQYATSSSPNGTHRSVLYQNSKGDYVDFPYSKYNFPSGTRNTSGSKHPKSTPVKWTAGGRINQAEVSGSTLKTQTVETTITNGFDKDKPFQGYIDIIYSIKSYNDNTKPTFNDKKYHVYLNFTQKAPSKYAIEGLKPVWVNNTTKRISIDNVISQIRDYRGNVRVFLHGINLIAPKIKPTKEDKSTNWYTMDKTTKDNSSCKMYLSKIEFNAARGSVPGGLESCGKTVNDIMHDIVEKCGYTVVMEYGKHRCDDKINFMVDNSNSPVFTAQEGDSNNILEWGNISYNPANELFNMSRCVFRRNDGTKKYSYVESKFLDSILDYQEQCTLITENDELGEKQAYWNARHNEKFNPEQTFTFTITVKGFPDLKFGELVEVIANSKKLNTLKEVDSIVLNYDVKDKPVLQTELGLGELAPDIQVSKRIKEMRNAAKKKSTYFFGTATPVSTESIYEWEQ